jgi:hypothetical protein
LTIDPVNRNGIRKGIARVLTVTNLKQRQHLREFYKGKKYLPLDLRAKKTRAIRRQLTKVLYFQTQSHAHTYIVPTARKVESHTEAEEKEDTFPHAQVCYQGMSLSGIFGVSLRRLVFLNQSSRL